MQVSVRHITLVSSLCILAVLTPPGRALAGPSSCGTPPVVLVLFDRSGSMSSGTKWGDAKTALSTLVNRYGGGVHFGLMLFPGPGGKCNAGQVDVPPSKSSAASIRNTLNATSPTGDTPLTASLKNAQTYMNGLTTTGARALLLITDGIPTCMSGGSSTSLSTVSALRTAGIKTYVVGFGSGVDATLLNNLALAGGTPSGATTKYHQANNAAQLSAALAVVGDAVSCCGNGTKDSGEACDKAIPPGKPGACPRTAADCDDKNPCTTDAPTGSECQVTCAHAAVTAPKNNDKCCPPGANANTDNDCNANCGNGALEAGETCDPGITSGKGKCKTLADCDDNDPCTKDTLAGSACQVGCGHTTIAPNLSAKDGCCPKGKSSNDDADCLPPCGPDKRDNCVDVCKDVTCPAGFYCYKGKCIVRSDANVPTQDPDAGFSEAGTNPGWVADGGCACHTAPGLPSPWAVMVVVLMVSAAAARRRRNR